MVRFPRIPLIVSLLAVQTGIFVWFTRDIPKGPDEFVYLLAGRSLAEGTDWSVREELYQGPLGLWANTLFRPGELADQTEAVVQSRPGMLPFALLLSLVTFLFAQQVHGRRAGLLALALTVFTPAFVAWSPQLTVDVPLTAMTTLIAFALWRWLDRPGALRAVALGIAIGLGLATKYSSAVFTLGVPLAVGIAWFRGLRRSESEVAETGTRLQDLKTIAVHGVLVGVVAVLALHASYGFQAPRFDPASHEFASGLLGELHSIPGVDPLLSVLPDPFVRGVDYQASVSRDVVSGPLLDLREGDWRYYPLTLWAKVPLPVWILVALASVAGLRSRRIRRLDLALLCPFVAFLGYMSLMNKLQGGIRYLLPLVPLLIVKGSAIAGCDWRGRAVGTWAGVTATLAVVASLAISFEQPTGSYQIAFSDPARIARTFYGQNSDWRFQYRPRGKQVLTERHPDLDFLPVGGGSRFGKVALYIEHFGQADPEQPERVYHWLRRFEPIDHFGSAWFVYEVEPEDFEQAIAAGDLRAIDDLSMAHLHAGDSEAARAVLETHAADGRDRSALRTAIDLLTKAATDGANDADRIAAGLSLLQVHRPDLALRATSRIEQMDPKIRFQLLFEGESEEAGLAFLEQFSRAPKDADTALIAAALWFEYANPHQARATLARAERPAPESPLRTKWDELEQRIGQAVRSYVKLYPENPQRDL